MILKNICPFHEDKSHVLTTEYFSALLLYCNYSSRISIVDKSSAYLETDPVI